MLAVCVQALVWRPSREPKSELCGAQQATRRLLTKYLAVKPVYPPKHRVTWETLYMTLIYF